MQWIIENITHESSYDELIKEVKRQGYKLKVIRGDYKHSDIDEFNSKKEPVLFFGSIEMTELVRQRLYMAYPVAYCTKENYLCTKYMSHFGKYLFNDRYAIASLAEIARQKFFFYGIFGKESMIFMRPDSGQKPFQARLFDIQDFDKFLESEKGREHQLAVVSTPKNIRGEWRFVVTKDQEIIAMSTYRYQGQITRIPTAPKGAIELVKELLKVGYYPDTIFCLDVCEDNDGNYWLLEMNSFSSAGLYECKKDLVVTRVSDIATKEWELWRAFNRDLSDS